MKIVLKILLLTYIFASPCYATLWYVDNTASGTNAGTSWTNAWESLADISWGSISAGDTIYISGGASGKTYSPGVTTTVGASGTSGSPITIKAGQDASHNGVVTIDYTGDADGEANFVAFILSGRSYVTFDGEYSGARHIKITNLSDPSDGDGDGIAFYASNGGEGLKVTYIEIDASNQLIEWNSTANSSVDTGPEVSYCKATNMIGDSIITIFPDDTSLNEFDWAKIHHNDLEILDSSDVGLGTGGADHVQASWGISLYNNIIRTTDTTTVDTTGQHPDGFQLNGHDLKVYNNTFINCGDAMLMGSDVGSANGIDRYYIYNNIFVIENDMDNIPEMIRLFNINEVGAHLSDILIANNLFIDSDYGITRGVLSFTGNIAEMTGDITIKNNIFYNCGNSAYDIVHAPTTYAGVSWDIDNNVYYTTDSPDLQFEGSTYSVAQWIASIDTNGSSSQPLFVNYTENDSTSDYRLTSGDTVARDQGVDLSAYFTTDKDGNTRTGTWDIGPYECQGHTMQGVTIGMN